MQRHVRKGTKAGKAQLKGREESTKTGQKRRKAAKAGKAQHNLLEKSKGRKKEAR
jgi:hypothetical protein